MTTKIAKILIIMLCSLTALPAQTQSKNPTPKIITEQHVKNYWLNKFPQPRTLDGDYHQKKKSYAQLVANIRAGVYDHEAKVKALDWNIEEYQRAKDFNMADQSRKTLQLLMQQEEERKRTAAAEAAADSQRRVESQLRNIESQLGNMESQLMRMRFDLNIR